MTDMSETVSLTRPIKTYVRDFALWYIGLAIFLALFSLIFDVGLVGGMMTPFFAALVIGEKFVKFETRAPSRSERKSVTMKSFLVVFLFNLVGGILFIVPEITKMEVPEVWEEIPTIWAELIIVGVVAAIVLLSILYGMLWLAYGWWTSMRAKKLLTKR